MGENLQSINDFEAVLKLEPVRPVRVVSLVGLAESLMASAKKHQDQFFMSNVKDACTQAITCLIRYVRCGALLPLHYNCFCPLSKPVIYALQIWNSKSIYTIIFLICHH